MYTFYYFQSTTLGDILYQTEWYNLEAPLQRDLILVMLRANRPIVLRAGPFGSMSYETIVMVCYQGIHLKLD